MPRGQRNETSTTETTRTTRPRLTDEQKAIAEVDKLAPRVKTTEDKLRKVRAQAAELDEQLKADQKLLTWALQNPFLPEGYGQEADVPAADAGEVTPTDDDANESANEGDGAEDDIPGASVVSEAAEERVELTAVDDEDPFAGR